jgi:hypothetical protein
MPAPTILLHARSVSLALPDGSGPVRVLSVHRRALNLMDEAGRIIAVVTPEVGDGPFHIVLAQSASFDALHAGDTGAWRENSVQVGHWRVDWAQARRWHPQLTPILISRQALDALTECVRTSDIFQNRWAGMDARTIARMQEGAARIAPGITEGDKTALQQGASLLAGLGPGLTPAGDDYLLGALARLWLDATQPEADDLSSFALAAAAKTTRISRAWLQYAARGQFDVRWHDLQRALLLADEEAICRAAHRILGVGATSGPQAMAGFLLT